VSPTVASLTLQGIFTANFYARASMRSSTRPRFRLIVPPPMPYPR